MFRTLIIASPGFKDFDLLLDKCSHALSTQSEVLIIYGLSQYDKIGHVFANATGKEAMKVIPESKPLSTYADAVIAFTNGTDNMTDRWIKAAEDNKMKLKIYRF